MSNEPRAQAGLSAYDVRNYGRSIEREFGCRVKYLVSMPLRQESRHALDVHVCAEGIELGTGRSIWYRGASRVWPTGECRTFTGLMYRLLHDLELKLEEMRTEQRSEQQGRLRGF